MYGKMKTESPSLWSLYAAASGLSFLPLRIIKTLYEAYNCY